ncbi:MAG: SDR family NAD(P)-dependent oxidoreductase [Cyanobacteria bacterium P01_A01_bin.114]
MKLSTRKQSRFCAKYGPWAVVSGASSGIGREISLCLAKAGLNLVLIARSRNSIHLSVTKL